jgi:hypothetical protein
MPTHLIVQVGNASGNLDGPFDGSFQTDLLIFVVQMFIQTAILGKFRHNEEVGIRLADPIELNDVPMANLREDFHLNN